MEIIIKKMSEEEAKKIGIDVENWDQFERKGPFQIDWEAQEQETAYVIEGETFVTIDGKETKLTKGTFLSFPKGVKCTWNTPKYYKKVYKINFKV